MSFINRWTQIIVRPHLRLIALIGLIVPRRLRADWRQEWETELRYREMLLADWDRLDSRHKVDLLARSTSAFWDALWLQRRRLEAEVVQDLRYGARMLVTSPGFTIAATLTLALGIGANTAIFTLLDKVLIRALPVEAPNRLVTFVKEAGEPVVVSYPRYTDVRDRTDVLSGVIAYFQRPFSLSVGGNTERVTGEFVSGNYFSVLGVRPALGRFFLPEEDQVPGRDPVVVISHGAWRRRFGADPAVLGRSVTVNGHAFTVVGVAPSEFTGVTRGTVSEVYVPLVMHAEAQQGNRAMFTSRTWSWLRLIGRLQANVTREQAQAALATAGEEAGAASGPKSSGTASTGIVLTDGSRGNTGGVHDLSLPLKLMMGVVAFVLLIACANVANLLLARGSTRSKEIAVRHAVGASRWRVVRQLLTESLLLAALGGVAGLFVARWLVGVLLGFQQQTSFVPRVFDGALDVRALGFTLALSVLTALVFSLAPAWQMSKPELVAALKRDAPGLGGGRRFGLRNMLVVAQVALSLVVLIGAGLCVKSLRALQAIDPGFEPAKVLTASFDLGPSGYSDERGRQFVSELTRRVGALPGVEAVSVARIVAFSDVFWVSGATVEGYDGGQWQRQAFDFNAVSPDYFRTLGAGLLRGREFTWQDTHEKPPVIIVNEATARRYWPGQDAVGKRTSRGEVVGVVRDIKEKGLTVVPRPTIYLSLQQGRAQDFFNLTLHVRTAIEPHAVLAAMRREIQALDATLPVYNLQTMGDARDGSLYTARLAAALLTLFAVLALVVAAVGIYGVLSYAVTERTREMGIRLAHGAQAGDLLKLIVRQGMTPTLIGVVIGLGASFVLTRLMARLLFGVSVTDPLTFGVIPVLLAAVALLACWIPARRATRMDPLTALRHE